jgi:hypothetical protein
MTPENIQLKNMARLAKIEADKLWALANEAEMNTEKIARTARLLRYHASIVADKAEPDYTPDLLGTLTDMIN